MVGFLFKRILLPLILWFFVVALSYALIPAEYAPLRPLPGLFYLIVLVYWWMTALARWLVRHWRWVTVGYLLTNLAVAFALSGALLAVGYLLESYDARLATLATGAALIVGPGWFLWSIFHLLQKGGRRRKGILWRLLDGWLEQSSGQPAAGKRTPAKTQPATRPCATPARYSTPSRSGLPYRVSNDAQVFVAQAQEWATRQEYAGNYAPFMAEMPTYRQMSLEQQQWYFYWRTQLRQGKLLATDLSYLFVYLYELLNVVGVASPADARGRLVSFWQSYRTLQPELDPCVVDWVADFSVLHNLEASTLPWYAHALAAGAISRNTEIVQLEAWHQQGRDYDAIPAPLLYELATYATEQNKFYQAHQGELALDDALKRGVALIDRYVQESQRLSLYELHLPTPTQTVMRPPLLGALHCYPTTPIVIGHVRPWLSAATLKDDLKAILRYTENILRTQAAYKTKLRGVTLPAAWAAVLDQAFVKVPPKRVVSIDLAGAAALQRESDELRQRLLNTGEPMADSLAPTELPTESPTVQVQQPTPVTESLPPNNTLQIQRPPDAPDGLLTDLPALTLILQSADSEATALLSALRGQGWQSKPGDLNLAGTHQFANVIFDSVNECALEAVGDALLFIEGEEWVVAEDYRDEIAYLLDHPDFEQNYTQNVGAHRHVPIEAEATSSTVTSTGTPTMMPTMTGPALAVAELDLIPTGWEECVRQMQPQGWATLAIVMEQEACWPKLEALARSHFVTANQLLDQVNEIGLATVGDNLIDVAMTPPQLIDEYRDALAALLLWAQEHDQIEGLP